MGPSTGQWTLQVQTGYRRYQSVWRKSIHLSGKGNRDLDKTVGSLLFCNILI